MNQIPIPAHVHYEMLLKILEQQTSPAVQDRDYANRARTQELIVAVRKALSLQRSLEADWQQRGIDLDYRWSGGEPQ
ncbi:DUF5340 domain-containing protein [Synechococcus sp. PCC 7336]|uniref:DUF5340 domain-containing protein n=1 Tax=Synechococcus sp. PCC 7336 TaxID=195250 RepID=UPI0003497E0E|nr:DUF5340 domain-containing protein [Synechococcus sp. PCC 7336]